MATITEKSKGSKGVTFKFHCCVGRDEQGKQLSRREFQNKPGANSKTTDYTQNMQKSPFRKRLSPSIKSYTKRHQLPRDFPHRLMPFLLYALTCADSDHRSMAPAASSPWAVPWSSRKQDSEQSRRSNHGAASPTAQSFRHCS